MDGAGRGGGNVRLGRLLEGEERARLPPQADAVGVAVLLKVLGCDLAYEAGEGEALEEEVG